MTFRQASALGAHVRKGETGSMVVYANTLVRAETDEAGDDVEHRIPFLKAYTVFNLDQIEGLPDIYTPRGPEIANPDAPIVAAKAFFAQCGADVRHGGASAFYAPGPDYVQMPLFASFRSAHD